MIRNYLINYGRKAGSFLVHFFFFPGHQQGPSANYRNDSIKRGKKKRKKKVTTIFLLLADPPANTLFSTLLSKWDQLLFEQQLSHTELLGVRREYWPATVRFLKSGLASFLTTLPI